MFGQYHDETSDIFLSKINSLHPGGNSFLGKLDISTIHTNLLVTRHEHKEFGVVNQ